MMDRNVFEVIAQQFALLFAILHHREEDVNIDGEMKPAMDAQLSLMADVLGFHTILA